MMALLCKVLGGHQWRAVQHGSTTILFKCTRCGVLMTRSRGV